MYVKLEELEATKDNVVLEIIKWPATFTGVSGVSNIIAPNSVNQYDNGRETYLGKVQSSGHKKFNSGDYVAVDIYYGSHLPSEEKEKKIKVVPATGIILKTNKELKVMGDITKMEPGIDRIILKLRKKESKTIGGIIIPEATLSQDPTAQDVRIGDVIKSADKNFKPGDIAVIEAFGGKDVYLDFNKDLYVVCYAHDILAKVKQNKDEKQAKKA
jgi:co-chaperonin GroES (HSP10)